MFFDKLLYEMVDKYQGKKYDVHVKITNNYCKHKLKEDG